MPQRLMSLLVAVALLLTVASPIAAQTEIPEPFCGNLNLENCNRLRQSVATMLNLETYHTAITYTLVVHGLPEMPVDHAETALLVEGDYRFDESARIAMSTLALISREEPLAAVEAIGNDPTLLLDLYRGTSTDLTLTLTLTEEWQTLLNELDEMPLPTELTVAVRLVDGVLYVDLRELQPWVPELAASEEWVAIEIVKALEMLAADGTLSELADEVASSTTGRSVTGLDPMMANLIVSMRTTFGHPKLLEEFMTIRRQNDVEIAADGLQRNRVDRTAAYFETEFDVLDFIFSNEFRTLLQQVFEVAAATDDEYLPPEEAKQIADVFWFVAPALFRDLEINSSSTVGLDSNYELATTSRFYWDLTTLIQLIEQFGEMELENRSSESYIAFYVETANSAFDQPITVTAPPKAEIIPLDKLGNEFSRSAIIDLDDLEAQPPSDIVVDTTDLSTEALAYQEEGVQLLEAGDRAAAIDQLNMAVIRNPELATAYYYRGLAYSTDNREAAAVDFDQAIELDSTLAAAYYQRGLLAAQSRDWEAARADYDETLALVDATDEMVIVVPLGDLYYARGLTHKELGNYTQASTDFNAAVTQDEENYRAWTQWSDTLSILGDYSEAVRTGNQAVELAPTDDWAHAVRGNAYYRQGDYEAAITDFSAAIAIYPEYTWAYAQRANAYAYLENYEATIADASMALTLDPTYDYAYAIRGHAHDQLADEDAALDDFTRAIELNAGYAYAYYSRGRIYERRGEIDLAFADYSSAIAAVPNYVDPLLNRGYLYTQTSDFTKALADYDAAVAAEPENPVPYNDRGVAYELMGDWEAALADYSTALEYAPEYRLALENRGDLYRRDGQYTEALSDFNELIATDPNDAIAYYRRGLLYEAIEDFEQALLDYTEAILLDDGDPTYYGARGSLYHDLGKEEASITDYTAAIQLDPTDSGSYNSRGIAYEDLERYEEAIADFDQALALNPDSTSALNNRAIAYEKQGEYGEAIIDYTEAIELNPDEPLYYRNRAGIYRTLNRYEKAIDDYTTALKLEPNHVNALYYRGDSYRRLGENEKALADFGRVLSLDEEDADAHYGIGQILYSEGDLEGAIKSYTIVVEFDPEWSSPYNSLCWSYSLLRRAEEALPYCEKAVALDQENPYVRDSRGLAHALLGNLEEAIADFQFYVDEVEESGEDPSAVETRRSWITALQAGEDPFTNEVLDSLRDE